MTCKICHNLVPCVASGNWSKEISEEKRKQMVKVYLTHVFSELVDSTAVWDICTAPEFPFCTACSDILENIYQLVDKRDNIRKKIKNFIDRFTEEILTFRKVISMSKAEFGVDTNVGMQLGNEFSNSVCKICYADYLHKEQSEDLDVQFVKKLVTTFEKHFLGECFDRDSANPTLSFCKDCLHSITSVTEINDELENAEEELTLCENNFAIIALKSRKNVQSQGHFEDKNCKEMRNSEGSLENPAFIFQTNCSSPTEGEDFGEDDCIIIGHVSSSEIKGNENSLFENEQKFRIVNSPSLSLESTADNFIPNSTIVATVEQIRAPQPMPNLKACFSEVFITENNSMEADGDGGPPNLMAVLYSPDDSLERLSVSNSENVLQSSSAEVVKMIFMNIAKSVLKSKLGTISGIFKCHLYPEFFFYQQEFEKHEKEHDEEVNEDGNCIGTIGEMEISKVYKNPSQVPASQDELLRKGGNEDWSFYCKYCQIYFAKQNDLISHATTCRLRNMAILNSQRDMLLSPENMGDSGLSISSTKKDTDRRDSPKKHRSRRKYSCRHCSNEFTKETTKSKAKLLKKIFVK